MSNVIRSNKEKHSFELISTPATNVISFDNKYYICKTSCGWSTCSSWY